MTQPVIIPRLMKEGSAAQYLGISVTKLRSKNIRRRVDGGNMLYDRHDLDTLADELPYEEEPNEWDAA